MNDESYKYRTYGNIDTLYTDCRRSLSSNDQLLVRLRGAEKQANDEKPLMELNFLEDIYLR